MRVPNGLLGVFRGLSLLSGLALLGISVFGVRQGALTEGLTSKDGLYTTMLSVYLGIFALLIVLGHVRAPKKLLRQFLFLNAYGGRGLFEVFVGSSLIVMRDHYGLVALVAGIVSVVLGAFGVLVSCPCCEVDDYNSRNSNWPDEEGEGDGDRGGKSKTKAKARERQQQKNALALDDSEVSDQYQDIEQQEQTRARPPSRGSRSGAAAAAAPARASVSDDRDDRTGKWATPGGYGYEPPAVPAPAPAAAASAHGGSRSGGAFGQSGGAYGSDAGNPFA